MRFTAIIKLPGGILRPERTLTVAADNESAAWDVARAACSPSEYVEKVVVAWDGG